MDLFEYMRSTNMEKEAPLAARMRPRTLDEVVGQEHIIGKDKLLYRAIKADKISSIIFYGPPGTGKTTLAKVIANTTSAEFRQINATVAGKKDMEEVVEKAKELQGMYGKRTILFIDEIHRFNKGQQDYNGRRDAELFQQAAFFTQKLSQHQYHDRNGKGLVHIQLYDHAASSPAAMPFS